MAKLTRYMLMAALSMLMSGAFFIKMYGQNNHRLVIRSIDKDSLFIEHNLSLKSSFSSVADCSDYINKLPRVLQQNGYISSSVDSLIETGNQTVIYLFLGDKYNVLNLHVRDQDKYYLQQTGWELNPGKRKKLNFEDYRQGSDKLLDYFEANGY
ncbi:MAG TPA: hypothetical protein VK369_14425, partial [Segetibacter sp.]|nr:hypothetical protein [Segetibacter sp.]